MDMYSPGFKVFGDTVENAYLVASGQKQPGTVYETFPAGTLAFNPADNIWDAGTLPTGTEWEQRREVPAIGTSGSFPGDYKFQGQSVAQAEAQRAKEAMLVPGGGGGENIVDAAGIDWASGDPWHSSDKSTDNQFFGDEDANYDAEYGFNDFIMGDDGPFIYDRRGYDDSDNLLPGWRLGLDDVPYNTNLKYTADDWARDQANAAAGGGGGGGYGGGGSSAPASLFQDLSQRPLSGTQYAPDLSAYNDSSLFNYTGPGGLSEYTYGQGLPTQGAGYGIWGTPANMVNPYYTGQFATQSTGPADGAISLPPVDMPAGVSPTNNNPNIGGSNTNINTGGSVNNPYGFTGGAGGNMIVPWTNIVTGETWNAPSTGYQPPNSNWQMTGNLKTTLPSGGGGTVPANQSSEYETGPVYATAKDAMEAGDYWSGYRRDHQQWRDNEGIYANGNGKQPGQSDLDYPGNSDLGIRSDKQQLEGMYSGSNSLSDVQNYLEAKKLFNITANAQGGNDYTVKEDGTITLANGTEIETQHMSLEDKLALERDLFLNQHLPMREKAIKENTPFSYIDDGEFIYPEETSNNFLQPYNAFREEFERGAMDAGGLSPSFFNFLLDESGLTDKSLTDDFNAQNNEKEVQELLPTLLESTYTEMDIPPWEAFDITTGKFREGLPSDEFPGLDESYPYVPSDDYYDANIDGKFNSTGYPTIFESDVSDNQRELVEAGYSGNFPDLSQSKEPSLFNNMVEDAINVVKGYGEGYKYMGEQFVDAFKSDKKKAAEEAEAKAAAEAKVKAEAERIAVEAAASEAIRKKIAEDKARREIEERLDPFNQSSNYNYTVPQVASNNMSSLFRPEPPSFVNYGPPNMQFLGPPYGL